MKAITIFDDYEYLRQNSKAVDIVNDKEISKDIATLKQFCMENDAYAMAAIQLGINKRILYVCAPTPDVKQKDESLHFVMINPIVLEQSGKTTFWEACVSCYPYCSLVERPYKMKIKYYTPQGEETIRDFEGFVCTVLSHELDHFDGVFHMDRALKTISCTKDERKELRKKEPYTIIRTDGEFKYAPIIEKINYNSL